MVKVDIQIVQKVNMMHLLQNGGSIIESTN